MWNKIKKGSFLVGLIMVLVSTILFPIQAASSNNYLADISFSVGELTKYAFTPSRTWYELTIPEGTEYIKVNATAQDANAKVTIAGHQNIINSKSKQLVVTVVSESGAKRFYTFVFKYQKGATTTTTTNPETTSPEPEESSIASSSENETSTSLSFLGLKDERLNRNFDREIYEYTAIVKDLEAEYEVEYITDSPSAVVNIVRSKNKYVIEVINDTEKTKYVINLQEQTSHVLDSSETIKNVIIRDVLIAFILLVVAILLFILSRRLRVE